MTPLLSEDYPVIIEFFKAHGFTPARMIAFERKLNPVGIF